METTIVTSKQVRQRLGSVILDLKYIDDKVFLIEKVGEDDFVGVIMSASLARENGIEIPEKGSAPKTESKPETKKKK